MSSKVTHWRIWRIYETRKEESEQSSVTDDVVFLFPSQDMKDDKKHLRTGTRLQDGENNVIGIAETAVWFQAICSVRRS